MIILYETKPFFFSLFRSFILGDLRIEIGDFVLVRNDDALDPEDFMSCYVAQVKNLFDTGIV